MPLLEPSHVFASHIGHTGKTTLCFQLSCAYAKQHTSTSVLMIDFAEEGDLTKRLLGGVDNSRQVESLHGGIFKLLETAEPSSTGLTRWLWSSDVDISTCAIQVQQYNSNVPGNVYLVSSGAMPHQEPNMPLEWRTQVAAKIRTSLQRSSPTWKVFCDTDGDRRPSQYTQLAYGLCHQAIVPLTLNKGDLDRTETMLSFLQDYRQRGEVQTQVQMVVWNNVRSIKEEACKAGGCPISFTPTKVSLDLIQTCNERLRQISSKMSGLFVHGEASADDFDAASVVVMRSIADNVLKPSEEEGMPIATMVSKLAEGGKKQLAFSCSGVSYTAKQDVIENAEEAVNALQKRLEAMVLAPP